MCVCVLADSPVRYPVRASIQRYDGTAVGNSGDDDGTRSPERIAFDNLTNLNEVCCCESGG